MAESTRSLRFKITLAPAGRTAAVPATPPSSTAVPSPSAFHGPFTSAETSTPVAANLPLATIAANSSATAGPLPSNLVPLASQPTAIGAAPRYGGLVRISELRQQGVDVLLPAMTPGTRRAGGGGTSRADLALARPPVVYAVGTELPARVAFAEVRGGAVDGVGGSLRDAFEDLVPSSSRARGRGRDGRDPLLLKPDGSLCEHRWYVKGGRRVLVYNGQTYKGTAAHRLWQRVKRHNISDGGGKKSSGAPRSRAKAKKKAKKGCGRPTTAESRLTRESHTPVVRVVSPGGSRRLDTHAGGGNAPEHHERMPPLVPGYAPTSLFPEEPWGSTTRPSAPASPRRPPRKVLLGPPPLQRTLQSSLRTPSAEELQGLAALSSHVSGRAREAAARACDTSHRAAARLPIVKVVEIDDNDDGGENDDISHREKAFDQHDDGAVENRKRPRSASCSTVDSDSSSEAWPSRYFGEDADGSDASTTDSFTRPASATDNADAHVSQSLISAAPTLKRMTMEGKDVVELDGWLYPAELLHLITGADVAITDSSSPSAAASPLPTTGCSQPAASKTAAPRLPATGARTTGQQAGATGLAVLGGGGRSFPVARLIPAVTDRKATAAVGPHVGRYEDDGLPEDLGGGDVDDLFDRGDEIGGFRF